MAKTIQHKRMALMMAMLLTVSAPVSTFGVIPSSVQHWAQNSLQKLVDVAVMGGYENGELRPEQAITRAELVTMINRLFGYEEVDEQGFVDVAEDKWYTEQMLIAKEAGYYKGVGNNMGIPDAIITRQDAMVILANVFRVEEEGQVEGVFTDENEIASYAQAAINALYQQGIVAGDDKGAFNPEHPITRGEIAALFDRITGQIFAQSGYYDLEAKEVVVGQLASVMGATTTTVASTPINNLFVMAEGVTIANAQTKGSVYLANSAAGGAFKLENCKVQGDLFVEAGVEVILDNVQVEGRVILLADDKVTLSAVNDSKVAVVIATEAEITLEGSFESIEIVEGIDREVPEIESEKKPGSSNDSSGNNDDENDNNQDVILHTYGFDATTEGWTEAGTWQAAFGTPAVEWSDDLGQGALKVNAKFLGDQSWSELKLENKGTLKLNESNCISYDLYFDLGVDGVMDSLQREIDAHLLFDGETKIGQGANKLQLSAFEQVEINGKKYAKATIKNMFAQAQAAEVENLWIAVVANSLAYEGPMYIDNIVIQNVKPKDHGDPGVLPTQQEVISTEGFETTGFNLVDSEANDATKSLFAYMKNTAQDYMMFGHQNTNSQGITMVDKSGKHSDVNDSVGAFPAVFGWDTLALTGNEGTFDELVKWSKEAAAINGVITISAHMPNFTAVEKNADGTYNFKEAPNSNDTSGDVVSQLLIENSEAQQALNAYLDLFADYANQIKTANGEAYPILFRPWHENTGNWFWWGQSHCTTEEYVQLFRYTVEYLRDEKGLDNILYIYSPNGHFVDEEDYLKRYPGDEYVDIIGFDMYHDNPKVDDGWMDKFIKDCEIVVDIANARGKIATVAETGVRYPANGYGLHPTQNEYVEWYTDVMDAVQNNDKAKQIAYMLVWRNGGIDHFWVPFRNHPVYGHHEMLDDFITYYNDPYTIFNDSINEAIYGLDVTLEAEEAYAYISSPIHKDEVADEVTVQAKVFNYDQEVKEIKVVTTAQAITLASKDGVTYEGQLDTTKEANDAFTTLDLMVVLEDGTKLTDSIELKIYNKELIVKELDTLDAVSYGGNWAADGASITTTGAGIQVVDDKAFLDAVIADDGTAGNWTWQEVKFNLPVQGVDTANVLTYDVYFETDKTTGSAISVKPGMNLADAEGTWQQMIDAEMHNTVALGDLPRTTVAGVQYSVASYEIPYSKAAEEAVAANGVQSIMMNFIGRDFDYEGKIGIGNVTFKQILKEEVKDPTLVDTFEDYLDSDDLASKYLRNPGGGAVNVTLEEGNGGKVMGYDYELSPGYAGIVKTLGVDWSGCDAVQFWLDSDGQGQQLAVQIRASAQEYEYHYTLGNETKLHEVPFSEFKAKGTGAPLTAAKAKNIEHIGFYVNAADDAGKTVKGKLLFDDICAVNAGYEEPEVPEEEPEVEIKEGLIFGFEKYIQNWQSTAGKVELSADWSVEGDKSLKAPVVKNAEVKLENSNGYDLSDYSRLVMTVRAEGNAQGKIYLKTGSGWTWTTVDTTEGMIEESGTEFAINLKKNPDADDVKSIGFQVYDAGSATHIYIDNIRLEK